MAQNPQNLRFCGLSDFEKNPPVVLIQDVLKLKQGLHAKVFLVSLSPCGAAE